MRFKYVRLGDVAIYLKEKIYTNKIRLNNYVSTENLKPDIGGVDSSNKLPTTKMITKFNKWNILISNIRPYFKKIWLADWSGGCSNDVLVLKATDKINIFYLYYNLACDRFFDFVMAGAKGTKMPRGDKDHIMKYELMLPSIDCQKFIANILSTLDQKIQINSKINQNLEATAQAIFKHWFVDFEFPNEEGKPYKSSGGEMVKSEIGMIPKRWRLCRLKELVDIIDNRGKTPPQEKNKTPYPIIDVKALSGENRIINYTQCKKFVSYLTYKNWFRNGHPIEGDILLSTVGSLAEMKIFYGSIGCIAQNVVAFRCKEISNLYMYQYLKHIRNEIISYDIGSVQPSIKVTQVIKKNILIPSKSIEQRFHVLMNAISNQIYKSEMQSVQLQNVRDTLLPKLMSGEIRVPMEVAEQEN